MGLQDRDKFLGGGEAIKGAVQGKHLRLYFLSEQNLAQHKTKEN